MLARVLTLGKNIATERGIYAHKCRFNVNTSKDSRFFWSAWRISTVKRHKCRAPGRCAVSIIALEIVPLDELTVFARRHLAMDSLDQHRYSRRPPLNPGLL